MITDIRKFILNFGFIGILLVVNGVQNVFSQGATALSGTNIGFMESTPPTFNGWTAKTGTYSYDYTQGTISSSNPLNNTLFKFTQTYNNPATAKFTLYGSSTNAFVINTNLTAKDEHSNNKLLKIPTDLGFTRSVRLGPTDMGGVSAELSYSLKINDTNSLLTFCYAMVLMVPHIGEHYINPTFEVDVVDNSDNLVGQCTFFQNTGDVDPNNLPSGWNLGTSGTYDQWVYCDWQQITINLEEYINQTVKLRIRVSGCGYNAHGGYGYFTAKVGRPAINLSGCAEGEDVVTTAEAPIGFNSYEWFEIPAGMTDQYDIDAQYSADKVVGNERILTIKNDMMNNADTKSFAVKLTSPTQHVAWDNSPAPACVTYIPATVNDMRPKFDKMKQNKYIPANPESDIDEIGFLFDDVEPRNNNYPLDWQLFAFGDGDTVEFKKKTDGHWEVDETKKTLAANHTRVVFNTTTQQPDSIFHIYQKGNYVFTRCAHSYPIDTEDTLECTKCETLNVIVPIRPSLLLTSVDTVCYGDKVTITATSPGDDATKYKYQWWYADDDITTAQPFYEGDVLTVNSLEKDIIVHVKVTTADDFYRWGWDTIRVQAFPDIQIEGDSLICMGENLHLKATDVSGGTKGMQWSYKKPTSETQVVSSSNTVVFEDAVKQDTTVFIIAETTKKCRAWKSVKITVVKPTVTADKKEICVGDNVVLTGSGAVDYSWTATPVDTSLQENVKGLNPVTVSPIETTEYTMSGYGQNGCQAKVNITITVVPTPIIKFGFSPNFVDMDEAAVTFTDSSLYSAKSVWTFSDGGTREGGTVAYTFSVLNSDSVGVHLVSSNRLGCSVAADTTLPIVLFSVWIPNAFSPDGDGINDCFFFMTQNDLEDVVFEVFNRWGTKLYSYETDKYTYGGEEDIKKFGWKGEYKDNYVQNGVYIWRLSYRRPGNTRVYARSGTITSVR